MRSLPGFLSLALAVTPLAAQQRASAPDGAAVFGMVCAMCHSVQPPAKAAPPMSHAASYYVRAHSDTDSAVAAIVAYLEQPDAKRSLLPAMAIERFGLMPSQAHLSDEQLEAVARYVLTLADSTHMGGHGPGHRGGHTPR